MIKNNKLIALSWVVLAGLFIVASPNATLAQALLQPAVQQSPGKQQPSPLPGASTALRPEEQPLSAYPQTQDGFRLEIAGAVEAYQKGDVAAGQRQMEQFRLRQSAEWLREVLGPDQSHELAKRYDREFERYLKLIEIRLASAKGGKLNISLIPGTRHLPAAFPHEMPMKLSGVVALKEPDRFNAEFSAKLTGKADLVLRGNFKSVSWEDTFVYQDGAFRFIGGGGFPFWVWQDRTDGKKPEAP